MPVTSGTLPRATSLPNPAETAGSGQTETQHAGRSDARLSHPDLPGRTVQFSQSAGETLRDLPVDRARRQEAAQNALGRFLGAYTSAGATEETYMDMSGGHEIYEDMSGAQETYEDMSGGQETQGDGEGEYTYVRTSSRPSARAVASASGGGEEIYEDMSGGQEIYEDMSGSVDQDQDEGEYDYVRTPAGQDDGVYDDVRTPAGQDDGVYDDVRTSARQDGDVYEDMSGDVYEDMQQGEVYTEPEPVYEELEPMYEELAAVQKAPHARTADKTAAKALARQLKGVHPEVRGQMQQLIAAGKVSGQDQLVRLTNEKTATWVVNNRVDKWYKEGLAQFKKAGFPTSHLGTIPPGELFDTIEEAIQQHDGLFNYNEVKSAARREVSDYLHHNLLRK